MILVCPNTQCNHLANYLRTPTRIYKCKKCKIKFRTLTQTNKIKDDTIPTTERYL